MKQSTEHNAIRFEQARADSKVFRTAYPLSKELRNQFFTHVFNKLNHYVAKNSVAGMYPDFLKFARTCEARPEKEDDAAHLFYWWRLLNDANKNPSSNIFTEFHFEHFAFFKTRPLFLSWLQLAQHTVPDFYYVAEELSSYGCYLMNLENRSVVRMMLPDTNHPLPQAGSVISAVLLPFSNQLHLPVALYEFDLAATKDIVPTYKHLHLECDKALDPFQIWLKNYMSLLLVEKYSLSGEEPWLKE
ncbi:hypothetical protein JMA_04450 [Jeotgalibacillus malaysiensis]|uniref:Uncharacterized protein n=1 Tax=Jeotgalibacillus malaysiensis TaxID=1508404 RepID=A0A0B5AM62_9BACL|nr:hypothetical protein [Jeotgalibacillus malaysiensis]AJD89762.1 hypothetical protein JMA_04450 [Jeotgalibacillus malaysiensis]